MTNDMAKNCKNSNLTSLLEREADQERVLRRNKRLAQHKQWMRVMMEGQSTPNVTLKTSKV